MNELIDVKIKDQYNQIWEVKACLRKCPKDSNTEKLALPQRVEHIVVDNEIILPSIELLFESQKSSNIYRIIDA